MNNRNRTVLASLTGLALVGVATAHAAPLNQAIVASAAQVSVGAGVLGQDYEEKDDRNLVPTGYLNKEEGKIPALEFDIGLVSETGWYSELHFTYASGETDYDGYLQYSPTTFSPYETDTDNSIYEFRGNFGHLFGLTNNIALAPKVELGHLRWDRTITGSYGSSAEYTYTRYGAGLEVLFAATDRLVFSVEGMYGRQSGEVASDVVNEDIGTTAYTRFSAGVDYALTDRWHIGAEISRASYDSKESDVSPSGFLEPASETAHTRMMARVGFSF